VARGIRLHRPDVHRESDSWRLLCPSLVDNPAHRRVGPVPRADQYRLAGAMSRRDREEGRRMRAQSYLTAALAAFAARVEGEDPERGDVPGWVMITVMTAALVLAILLPFREAIPVR
jgi:hypothetical protein